MTQPDTRLRCLLQADGVLTCLHGNTIGEWKLVRQWESGATLNGNFNGVDHIRARIDGVIYAGRVGRGKAGTGCEVRLKECPWILWSDPIKATPGRKQKESKL